MSKMFKLEHLSKKELIKKLSHTYRQIGGYEKGNLAQVAALKEATTSLTALKEHITQEKSGMKKCLDLLNSEGFCLKDLAIIVGIGEMIDILRANQKELNDARTKYSMRDGSIKKLQSELVASRESQKWASGRLASDKKRIATLKLRASTWCCACALEVAVIGLILFT